MLRTPQTAPVAIATFLVIGGSIAFGGVSAVAATTSPSDVVLQIASPSGRPFGQPEFSSGSNVHVLRADTTRGIDLRADTTAGPDGASFTLTPPENEPLTAGDYRLVGQQKTGTVKVPTLKIDAHYLEGDLDVLDVASDPTNGAVTRFDAVVPGIGEVRFGEDTGRTVVFGSRSMVFPRTFVGLPPVAQQETIHNGGTVGVALGRMILSGPQSPDFSSTSSTCGSSLAPGASCSFTVQFAPKHSGPSNATLSVTVGGIAQTVPLTGSAFLGTSGIRSAGKDIVDRGATTVVTQANTAMSIQRAVGGWLFLAAALDGSGSVLQVRVTSTSGRPPAMGTHKTVVTGQGSGDTIVDTVHSSACDTTGTESVKQFTLDPVTGLPATVDMSWTQYCTTNAPQTGSLQWQARSDVTPPATPTALRLSGNPAQSAMWTPSTSRDTTKTIARLVEGTAAGATVQSGIPLAVSGNKTTIPSVPTGERYTIFVFTVDFAGNVSTPTTAAFGTAPVTVTAPGRPTITTVTMGPGTETVTFTPPTSDGGLPITGYKIVTLVGDYSVMDTSSPLTLTGLPDGDGAYPVEVIASNAAGAGAPSLAYEP